MKTEKLHTLPEFIAHNAITTAYGAVVAVASVNESNFRLLMNQLDLVHFYAVFILIDGAAEVNIDDEKLNLSQHSVLRIAPMQRVESLQCSNELCGYLLLIESTFYAEIVKSDDNLRDVISLNVLDGYVYKVLSKAQTSEFVGIVTQIERTINQPHVYKKEMVGFLVHLVLMHIRELISHRVTGLHDLKHKENIFKIFIHLASNNFKQQRQINFYAAQMNITPTYLSRIVKEVSGNTVNGYLQSFLYGEACKQLRMTDKPIGELAFDLGFKDQSAFTNFFKMKSGVSPKEYRK